MKEINPEHIKILSKIVNTCPYFELLSMSLKSLSNGESLLEMELNQNHLQPYGVIHGGVAASLIDAAAFWAVYSSVEDDVGLTTVELKLNYLATASKGSLVAKGRCIKAGKKLCLGEATIENGEGGLVAHGTSTIMVTDFFEIEGHSDLPPKYLEKY
jgi:uncharacterized protein (TIGR00369 family)